MLIRIKFDGKSRKLSEKVTTVSDLKAKINELFGIPQSQIQIVYKDCDGELVDVIDDEDLKNCYNEVNELNQSSLTFIISNKQRSKSRSKSRRPTEAGEETKLSGPLMPMDKSQTGDVQVSELSFAQKGDSGAIGEPARPEHSYQPMPADFMEDALQAVAADCPGLLTSHKLLSAVLGLCAADLETIIKRHYRDVVQRQPELLTGAKEGWTKGEPVFRTRGETAESSNQEGIAASKPQVNQERSTNSRGGHFEFRGKDRSYPQSFGKDYRDQHGSQSDNYRPYKHHKDTRDYRDNRRSGNDYDRNKEDSSIADPLRKLCQKFPQKSKDELRTILQQNPDKSVHQLESLITQSRKAKSRYY